jgi:hypothetical protein
MDLPARSCAAGEDRLLALVLAGVGKAFDVTGTVSADAFCGAAVDGATAVWAVAEPPLVLGRLACGNARALPGPDSPFAGASAGASDGVATACEGTVAVHATEDVAGAGAGANALVDGEDVVVVVPKPGCFAVWLAASAGVSVVPGATGRMPVMSTPGPAERLVAAPTVFIGGASGRVSTRVLASAAGAEVEP